ncbi:MAG TPA: ABC transporter ATP-binding protein/permease [Candidatus Eisenbergiella intestinipullorum]|nr:ABC transporter ATP-binding protein/permease [Candidatus Eisenbergiella intestinipullorum]
MRKLSSYLFQHRLGYLTVFLSMAIAVSLDLLSPQVTRVIVDDVIQKGEVGKLRFLLPCLLLIGLGRCIFGYTKEFTSDLIGSSIATDIRKDLFTYLQSLSADFFDKNNTGELMSRVKDDIDRIWNALGYVSMLIMEVVFHTCLVLFCMYSLNWRLALIPTAAMLVTGVIAVFEERRLGAVYEEISEENAALNTVAEENLAGVRTVKAFAREKFEIRKFLSHNQRYYELNMKQSKVFVKYYPCFSLITKLLPLIVLLLGGSQVIRGELTLGSLTAFVEYSMNIVWPMEMLGWLSNDFSSGVGSYRKIRKIYQAKPSVTDPEQPVTLPAVQGKIEFDNVSFHKADGHEILHDISFTVEPGKTLGIMGATGAGKTSIIQLLERLYDATGGTIRLDGVNIRDLSLKQLRGSISLVMQDVFLFSDTISENVRLGKRELVNDGDIRTASESAQASGFIERLSEQYETVIGERGVGLSGGQKQRISIARAIAKHNPILILDDSTSALDMETEYAIQQALQALSGTTKLIIAHRISAVRNADEIIVLENGTIRERGTHESLLALHGLYYETWQSQYGAVLDTEGDFYGFQFL